MDAPTQPLAYSPADAATALGMSRAKLYELLAAGQIPVVKIGRRTLIRRDTLDRFLAEREAPAGGGAR